MSSQKQSKFPLNWRFIALVLSVIVRLTLAEQQKRHLSNCNLHRELNYTKNELSWLEINSEDIDDFRMCLWEIKVHSPIVYIRIARDNIFGSELTVAEFKNSGEVIKRTSHKEELWQCLECNKITVQHEKVKEYAVRSAVSIIISTRVCTVNNCEKDNLNGVTILFPEDSILCSNYTVRFTCTKEGKLLRTFQQSLKKRFKRSDRKQNPVPTQVSSIVSKTQGQTRSQMNTQTQSRVRNQSPVITTPVVSNTGLSDAELAVAIVIPLLVLAGGAALAYWWYKRRHPVFWKMKGKKIPKKTNPAYDKDDDEFSKLDLEEDMEPTVPAVELSPTFRRNSSTLDDLAVIQYESEIGRVNLGYEEDNVREVAPLKPSRLDEIAHLEEEYIKQMQEKEMQRQKISNKSNEEKQHLQEIPKAQDNSKTDTNLSKTNIMHDSLNSNDKDENDPDCSSLESEEAENDTGSRSQSLKLSEANHSGNSSDSEVETIAKRMVDKALETALEIIQARRDEEQKTKIMHGDKEEQTEKEHIIEKEHGTKENYQLPKSDPSNETITTDNQNDSSQESSLLSNTLQNEKETNSETCNNETLKISTSTSTSTAGSPQSWYVCDSPPEVKSMNFEIINTSPFTSPEFVNQEECEPLDLENVGDEKFEHYLENEALEKRNVEVEDQSESKYRKEDNIKVNTEMIEQKEISYEESEIIIDENSEQQKEEAIAREIKWNEDFSRDLDKKYNKSSDSISDSEDNSNKSITLNSAKEPIIYPDTPEDSDKSFSKENIIGNSDETTVAIENSNKVTINDSPRKLFVDCESSTNVVIVTDSPDKADITTESSDKTDITTESSKKTDITTESSKKTDIATENPNQ